MIRTSSTACHHWKQEMVLLSGAFLAAAGEEEYPLPETGVKTSGTSSATWPSGYSASDPPAVSEPPGAGSS